MSRLVNGEPLYPEERLERSAGRRQVILGSLRSRRFLRTKTSARDERTWTFLESAAAAETSALELPDGKLVVTELPFGVVAGAESGAAWFIHTLAWAAQAAVILGGHAALSHLLP